MTGHWRDRAATSFQCQKKPASGSRGMVVSNHPLASSAGAEMLAAGGNAIDAAIATLFTLTVVEPMMVGIIGGGMAHIRLADGSHRFIDGQSTVPLAVRPDTYKSKPGSAHDVFDTVGDENLTGPKAVAVPGSLKAWCETLQRFGTMSLADVMQPAIKHAARGYAATPYLHECIADSAGEMRKDKEISAIYLPNGTPLKPGERVVQSEYAETLTYISQRGEAALYQGPLGDILVDYMKRKGGFITREDLTRYKTVERQPIRADYRGWEILGPPPPAASGVHIAQMLNILEGYDVASLGHNSADYLHRVAEAKRIAFADRAAFLADPALVPASTLAALISKEYAATRRREIDDGRVSPQASPAAAFAGRDRGDTVYLAAADGQGNIISFINSLFSDFGSGIVTPGTGVMLHNRGLGFTLEPGHPNRLAPGKRPLHTLVPAFLMKDGEPLMAFGVMGGDNQAQAHAQIVVNVVDFGMNVQEAGDVPRVRHLDEGLAVERGIAPDVLKSLHARGHVLLDGRGAVGGYQAVMIDPVSGVLMGGSDPRKDGQAVGY